MIILPQRAILCYVNPLAKHLSHRAILRTSSLAHKGQDCDHEHDVMEIPADLVDKMISELEPQDSGA